MMGHQPGSGQVVPLRRSTADGMRTGRSAGRRTDSRAARRPLHLHRTDGAGVVVARPTTSGDAAQARSFLQLLHAELVALQHRLNSAARDQRMRHEARELHARITELQRLCGGLHDRFGAPVKPTLVTPDPAPTTAGRS